MTGVAIAAGASDGPTFAALGASASQGASASASARSANEKPRTTDLQKAMAVLEVTRPLQFPRGARLPLYIWQANGLSGADDAEAERMLCELAARGISLLTVWNPAAKAHGAALAEAIRIGKMQKRLGFEIAVNANACFHQFYDGSASTAHIDEKGAAFFDESFQAKRKMGCPFALEGQWDRVRAQIAFFCEGYRAAGLQADMVCGDWETDGPIEWNGAWENSKRCVRCRQHVPNIGDFGAFQTALRKVRCAMQREVFVKTLQSAFPNARIGNYAEYPCEGVRYWYDWFEALPAGAPFVADQRAQYRLWHDGFSETGYTMAMPVIYPWRYIYGEYDFEDADYRWVYAMLLEASSAGRNRDGKAPGVALAPFVHWAPTDKSTRAVLAGPKPMSERAYRELLWHVLLRGADTLFVWCGGDLDAIKGETRPAHEVWAASLEYGEFLKRGKPLTYDVPKEPSDVVSGRVLGGRALVRRSHFGAKPPQPIELAVGGARAIILPFTDECRILPVE